jgi:hypothetical protein
MKYNETKNIESVRESDWVRRQMFRKKSYGIHETFEMLTSSITKALNKFRV